MASYKLCVFFIVFIIAASLAQILNPKDEKPLLECPPDEVYYKCELEKCFKTCKHLKTPPACPSIAPGCVKPACLCKEDFFRNADQKCVSADQCD